MQLWVAEINKTDYSTSLSAYPNTNIKKTFKRKSMHVQLQINIFLNLFLFILLVVSMNDHLCQLYHIYEHH